MEGFPPCPQITSGADRAPEARVQLPVLDLSREPVLIAHVGVLEGSPHLAPRARTGIPAVATSKGHLDRAPRP
jgi:hypothetical protein